MALLVWVLAVILVIVGFIRLISSQIVVGVVMIIVGLILLGGGFAVR